MVYMIHIVMVEGLYWLVVKMSCILEQQIPIVDVMFGKRVMSTPIATIQMVT